MAGSLWLQEDKNLAGHPVSGKEKETREKIGRKKEMKKENKKDKGTFRLSKLDSQ